MRKFPLAIRPPGFVIRCPFSKCKGHFMYNKLTSLSPSLSEFLQPGLHPSPEEDSVQLPAGVSVRCHPEQLPQLLWWLRDRSGWEGGHRKPAAPAECGHSDCSEWKGSLGYLLRAFGLVHSPLCAVSLLKVNASREFCPFGLWVGRWRYWWGDFYNSVSQQLQVQPGIVSPCTLQPARGTSFYKYTKKIEARQKYGFSFILHGDAGVITP